MVVYNFWVDNFPFLLTYGTLIPTILSIITIFFFIRLIIVVPIYLIGGKKNV